VEPALEEYSRRLREAGLGQHEDSLVGLARPGVRLLSQPIDSADRQRSRTRLGGDPDLPSDFTWPSYQGVPQSFVAQIDLAEMHSVFRSALPDAGLLSFFYDSAQSVWGFDPSEAGATEVVYFPDGVELATRSSPPNHPQFVRFDARSLGPQRDISFCPWESFELEMLELTSDELDAYATVAATNATSADSSPAHRLLGHASPIQGDMQLECQLVSNGLQYGDTTGSARARGALLRAGASDWRLLLQIDSDDDANMMWGDCGMLYWWMREADIESGRWDRAHLILQCC
jgi:uncharacterized protein YwqG